MSRRGSPPGDRDAFDRLVAAVYETLACVGAPCVEARAARHTLSTTALAHEAYQRLAKLERIQWQDRAHVFAAAAAMRRACETLRDSREAPPDKVRAAQDRLVALYEAWNRPDAADRVRAPAASVAKAPR